MSERKMAVYTKAMNRLKPDPALNNRVIARVREDAESVSELVIGANDRRLQPKTAQRVAIQPRVNAWKATSRTVAVAASLVMVLLLTAGGYRMMLAPVSWVDVDINPSVELGLNRLHRVITVDGVNEDGEALLQQVSLFGTKPENAVQAIVEVAARMGYMKADEPNVLALTVIAGQQENEDTLAKQIRSGADAALETEGLTAEIIEQLMTPERVQRAQALQNNGVDISPGKLNLIDKLGEVQNAAKDAGVEVDPFVEDTLYERSVKEIQAQTNAYRRAIKEMGETGKASAPGQLKKENKETENEASPRQKDKENGSAGKDESPGQQAKANGASGNTPAPGKQPVEDSSSDNSAAPGQAKNDNPRNDVINIKDDDTDSNSNADNDDTDNDANTDNDDTDSNSNADNDNSDDTGNTDGRNGNPDAGSGMNGGSHAGSTSGGSGNGK